MHTKSDNHSATYEANGVTNTLELHHRKGERFATITRRRHTGTNVNGVYLREATEQVVVDLNELVCLIAVATR